MINEVTLLGNVGTIEVTDKFIKLSVATNESYKEGDEWKTATEWHNCIGFGYLKDVKITNGDLCYIKGKIKTNKHNDTYYTNIIINTLKRLKNGQKEHSDNSNEKQIENTETNDNSEDIPF
jgi:single-strand DNA-binding protein